MISATARALKAQHRGHATCPVCEVIEELEALDSAVQEAMEAPTWERAYEVLEEAQR